MKSLQPVLTFDEDRRFLSELLASTECLLIRTVEGAVKVGGAKLMKCNRPFCAAPQFETSGPRMLKTHSFESLLQMRN